MTSTTFFLVFIPVLAIILLGVNLVLAPHSPYEEKSSSFECGFHSFQQTRSPFNISFFIFALLFLLFDLEILLVYPYTVSAYSNGSYGLTIMLVFFVMLTLGFVFELGKGALKIDSRQDKSINNDVPKNVIIHIKKRYISKSFSRRNFFKISIILSIGFVGRWFINDFFDINVFKDYTEHISIVYYSFMAGLSVLITELLNLIDGAKIPLGGVDLSSGNKVNSGKVINTGGKGFVNAMDSCDGNNGGVGSSTGDIGYSSGKSDTYSDVDSDLMGSATDDNLDKEEMVNKIKHYEHVVKECFEDLQKSLSICDVAKKGDLGIKLSNSDLDRWYSNIEDKKAPINSENLDSDLETNYNELKLWSAKKKYLEDKVAAMNEVEADNHRDNRRDSDHEND